MTSFFFLLWNLFRFGFDQQNSIILDQCVSQSSSIVKLFGSKWWKYSSISQTCWCRRSVTKHFSLRDFFLIFSFLARRYQIRLSNQIRKFNRDKSACPSFVRLFRHSKQILILKTMWSSKNSPSLNRVKQRVNQHRFDGKMFVELSMMCRSKSNRF